MLERLLELLMALLTGVAGIGVAAENAPAERTTGPFAVAAGLATAASHAGVALARVPALETTTVEVEVSEDEGTAHAADVLAQVAASAPEAAQQGLARAAEAVTTAPTNDGEAADAPDVELPELPVTPPAPPAQGPPADVPPADAPPSGVPARP